MSKHSYACSKREEKMALVKANKEKEDEQQRLPTVKESQAKSTATTPVASSNHERHES
jgi:hypothetical protein